MGEMEKGLAIIILALFILLGGNNMTCKYFKTESGILEITYHRGKLYSIGLFPKTEQQDPEKSKYYIDVETLKCKPN